MASVKFGIWMLIVLSMVKKARQTPMYESALLDIIALVDDSASINDTDFAHFMDVVSQLPEVFPVQKGETYMSLVVFSNGAYVALPLTPDREKFQDAVKNLRRERGNTETWTGLYMVRTLVLPDDTRKDVPDVVILLTDGCPIAQDQGMNEDGYKSRMNDTEVEAKKLRDMGVTIFLVYVGKFCQNTKLDPHEHQKKVVGGDPKRVFQYDNFAGLNVAIFRGMKDFMDKERCKKDEICLFADDRKERCETGWENLNSNSCKKWEPEKKCNVEDCQQLCKEKFNGADCEATFCSSKSMEMCEPCRRCNPKQSTAATETEKTPPLVRDDRRTRSDPEKDDTLLYVGIALGVLAFLILVLVVVLVIVVLHRKRRRRRERLIVLKQKSDEEPAPVPLSSHHSKSVDRSRVNSRTVSAHPSTNLENQNRQPSTMPKTGSPTKLESFKTVKSKQPPDGYLKMWTGSLKTPSSRKPKTVKRFQVSKRAATVKSHPSTPTAATTARAVRQNLSASPSRASRAVAVGKMQRSEPGHVSASRRDSEKNKTLPSWKPRKMSYSVGGVGKSRSRPVQVK